MDMPQKSNSAAGIPLTGNAPIGRRAMVERYTFTLPALVLLVFFLQLAVAGILLGEHLQSQRVINSMVGALFVNVAAALTYREFRRTPGTRRFAYILPSFIVPSLALTGVLLVARFTYSTQVLLPGIFAGLALVFLFTALQKSASGQIIYMVPGARTRALAGELGFPNIQILNSPADLAKCGDGVVVADLRQDLSSDWERGLARAVIHGTPVYHVKQMRESLTGRVQIEALSENSFGALVPSLSSLLLKRVVDVVASAVAIVLLAVPMVIIAMCIRINSPGPALYRHRRVGYRGREFDTLKFRTMSNESRDDDDLESQKTQDQDPRVTKVGRFLRDTRLDELPQLINVVMGEMSLIGPRPEALALSRWYDEHLDFYEYRHIVRPGITGWAQVNQGHVTELDDVYVKLQYDFYYIKNFSYWLDFVILARTVLVVFNGKGAR